MKIFLVLLKVLLINLLETLGRWLVALARRWQELSENPDGHSEGWFLLVGQSREETVEQAITRTAQAEGLSPDAVQGALVLGFAETDPIRDWPHWLEWRRPGFQGSFRRLRGYRRAQIERAGILAGPN
jgi:hypothetical protein